MGYACKPGHALDSSSHDVSAALGKTTEWVDVVRDLMENDGSSNIQSNQTSKSRKVPIFAAPVGADDYCTSNTLRAEHQIPRQRLYVLNI